ncbi:MULTISPECIES: hypothetical protein [Cupriavidus]
MSASPDRVAPIRGVHLDMAAALHTPPGYPLPLTVALPAPLATPFARLQTRGWRLLATGAGMALGGAALLAGGCYGLAGGGHVLPVTLTAIDLPLGLQTAAAPGVVGDLGRTMATGMAAGGSAIRPLLTVGGMTIGLLLTTTGLYRTYRGMTQEGETADRGTLSLLVGALFTLGGWLAPVAFDVVNDRMSDAGPNLMAAIERDTFTPAMLDPASQAMAPYLLAQSAQWQLQRQPASPAVPTPEGRPAGHPDREGWQTGLRKAERDGWQARLRTSVGQIPADAPVDPATRYVLERAATGHAVTAPARAFEAETRQAQARAARLGRAGVALGAGLALAGALALGLGLAIRGRVRRVRAWLQ